MQIPQAMVQRLLCDPVMAAKVILGVSLDAFQQCRLRFMWWCPTVEDHSGYSSGKTLVDWVYVQLRCLLIPDHKAGVIYQTFSTGQTTFWAYYATMRAPIFRAQLGRMDVEGEEDGKSSSKASSCYKQWFKNGSCVEMPAPGHLQKSISLASWRLNTLLLEEWTKSEAMSVNDPGGSTSQLLTRCTRESYNKEHPIWGNHITRTATAELGAHPSFQTHENLRKRSERGDPDVGVVSWNYKDYSGRTCHTGGTFREQYRIDKMIKEMKAANTPDKFRAEGLGLWTRSAKGWYNDQMLAAAIEMGRQRGLVPVISRAQDENY